MPKKKETNDHLLSIELLLANLLLKRNPSIGRIAKIMGIRKAKLIQMLGKEENSAEK